MRNYLLVIAVLLGSVLPRSSQAADVLGYSQLDGKRIEILSDQTWRYAERKSLGTHECPAVSKNVHFCGDEKTWQPALAASNQIAKQYRYDDRNFSVFIVENLGAEDGLTPEFMRRAAIQNAANAAGIPKESVDNLGLIEAEVDGKPAETFVYQFKIQGIDVVYANTMIIEKKRTVQAMTFTVGTSYTDAHKEITEKFLSQIQLK